MAEGISSALASLNPFGRKSSPVSSPVQDEAGEGIDNTTIAGGGHSYRQTDITRHQLRVSHALKSFLLVQGELSPDDLEDDSAEKPCEAVTALVSRPHISVPPEVVDRSHPLPEYYISSSHNTYLLAHQLYGTSSAAAYENALKSGARCVEIDAWDGDEDKEEPKVTHGYTLVSHIPFRAVCETIRDIVDQEAAQAAEAQEIHPSPILVSLENHCDAHGQQRLVDIMTEVWGERLLSKAIREKGHEEQEGGEHVTLQDLGSKIVLIVEYHLQGEKESDSSSSDDESSDEEGKALKEYKQKKKTTGAGEIIPELASLGVYAQSVKPIDNSWFEEVHMKNGPHHHLINVSETGLQGLMPASNQKIGTHNAHHLMRVFPKGTRITSKNLKPVPFWGLGAQICALNWQSFGMSLQLNEALFAGTDGYVLKPAPLRHGGDGLITNTTGRKKRLRLHVAGASDIPVPEGREEGDLKPYVTATLIHPGNGHLDNDNENKRRTHAYRQHKLGFLHHGENPPRTDPIWDETLEWEYEDSELVFLRILIKSDDAFAVNPIFVLTTIRIMYAAEGWNFIRMLDLKGHETKCSLLVKFQVLDAE